MKAFELLTEDELYFLEMEVFNGCGAKGWISFSKVLEMVEELEIFNKEKFSKFRFQMEDLCQEHDYYYYVGGNLIDKIRCDLSLNYNIQKLLWWAWWKIRLATFFAWFIGLLVFGNKHFSWGWKELPKKDVDTNSF